HFVIRVQDDNGIELGCRKMRIVRRTQDYRHVIKVSVANPFAEALEAVFSNILGVDLAGFAHERGKPYGQEAVSSPDVRDCTPRADRHGLEDLSDLLPVLPLRLVLDG